MAIRVVLAMLLVSAFTVRGNATNMADRGSPGVGSVPQTANTMKSKSRQSEVAKYVKDAVYAVNAFWTRHWSNYFTGSYFPPTVRGLYDATHAPICGGRPLETNNAAYCPGGDFVAFGSDLMNKGITDGNAFDYLVVAHEWGHAIQARLAVSLQAQQRELQADCLAGAELYGAARDHTLTFEQGDEKAIAKSLADSANETPWTSTTNHGDSFQRIENFDLGRTKGVRGCLPRT